MRLTEFRQPSETDQPYPNRLDGNVRAHVSGRYRASAFCAGGSMWKNRSLWWLASLAVAAVACGAGVSASTSDQWHHRPTRPGVVVFVGGYFYDPFFGPYPWWNR